MAADPEESKRAALVSIAGYLSATLAVLTAFLAVSATLLAGSTRGSDTWEFIVGVVLGAISFACGICGLGRQIYLLTDNDLDPYDGWLVTFTILHVLALMVAAIFMGLFASHHVNASQVASTSAPRHCISRHS